MNLVYGIGTHLYGTGIQLGAQWVLGVVLSKAADYVSPTQEKVEKWMALEQTRASLTSKMQEMTLSRLFCAQKQKDTEKQLEETTQKLDTLQSSWVKSLLYRQEKNHLERTISSLSETLKTTKSDILAIDTALREQEPIRQDTLQKQQELALHLSQRQTTFHKIYLCSRIALFAYLSDRLSPSVSAPEASSVPSPKLTPEAISALKDTRNPSEVRQTADFFLSRAPYLNAQVETCQKQYQLSNSEHGIAECIVRMGGLNSVLSYDQNQLSLAKKSCQELKMIYHPDTCTIEKTICDPVFRLIRNLCPKSSVFNALISQQPSSSNISTSPPTPS